MQKTLTLKDKAQVAVWLRSNASLNEVLATSRYGMVENERFSERAVKVYIWLWTWSAHRFHGEARRLQNNIFYYHGMAGLDRRFNRVNRIIERLKVANQANNVPLYHIEKNGAMYEVKSLSGIVQFHSMKKANCKDWLKEIARQEEETTV